MFYTILLGVATGMRTMTPIAVLCWAAYFGWLPVEGTWAFWMAKLASPIIFTVFAVGEYIGDTLPKTPSRKAPGPMLARLAFGMLCGAAVAAALGQPIIGGILLCAIGALIGTFGGFQFRQWLAGVFGRDLPAALLESTIALLFSLRSVAAVHKEVLQAATRLHGFR